MLQVGMSSFIVKDFFVLLSSFHQEQVDDDEDDDDCDGQQGQPDECNDTQQG